MAYKDKYGITAIQQKGRYKSVDTLDISWDCDDDSESDKSKRYPVFLVIPGKKKMYHEHVSLSRKGAKDLRDWLSAFLKDVGVE